MAHEIHPLKLWLLRNGKRQRDIHAATGITESAISKIITGKSRPLWDTAEQISRFTGGAVSLADFGFPNLPPQTPAL